MKNLICLLGFFPLIFSLNANAVGFYKCENKSDHLSFRLQVKPNGSVELSQENLLLRYFPDPQTPVTNDLAPYCSEKITPCRRIWVAESILRGELSGVLIFSNAALLECTAAP